MDEIEYDWGNLRGDDGPPCGYTHVDHLHEDAPMACVRAAGHPGGTDVPARDQHLADCAGQPVFFGDPIDLDAPAVTP